MDVTYAPDRGAAATANATYTDEGELEKPK